MTEDINFEKIYRHTPVSRIRLRQIISNVALAAAGFSVISKCRIPGSPEVAPTVTPTVFPKDTPTPTELSPESNNIQKARELLKKVGIRDSFVNTDPKDIFASAAVISQDQKLNNSIWYIFQHPGNQILGLGLNSVGEAVPLREGADGKPATIPGLDFEHKDEDLPVISYEQSDSLEIGNKKFIVVTYPNSLDSRAQIDQLFANNRKSLDDLTRVLFAHSQAPLNILHLADSGMPTQVFHHPDFTGEANGFTEDDLPSPAVRGASIIRYENETGKPTRTDIFLSLAAINKEANILGLPAETVLAGYFVNEAYGCSQETYRVSHSLPPIPGRSEAASTGADWGVRMLAIHDSPNPFFNSEIMQFIAKLAVPPTTVAAT